MSQHKRLVLRGGLLKRRVAVAASSRLQTHGSNVILRDVQTLDSQRDLERLTGLSGLPSEVIRGGL